MHEHQRSQPRPRGDEDSELEAPHLKAYQDPKLRSKPKELEKRGGAHYSTAAVWLLRDLPLNRGGRHIVNVANNGALPDQPAAAVEDVTCQI